MARDEWCRRTTWTKKDQQEFFARNERSRGGESKAQYMRIQAHTLFETGKPQLVQSALKLLEHALSRYPRTMDRALALETAGQCCEFLGRTEDAINYYRQAIQREREFPGIGTNAGFRMAKLAVENTRQDLYSEAAAAAEAHGAPVFPWHAYFLNGIRAVLSHQRGDFAQARALAQVALEAASIRDTGLSHGRGHLGTVKDITTRFHRILLGISDA